MRSQWTDDGYTYTVTSAMDDADMGQWGYSYDGVGSLTVQTDTLGCATSLCTDGLDRLTGKTYSGPAACASTSAVTMTTDGEGRWNTFDFSGPSIPSGPNSD